MATFQTAREFNRSPLQLNPTKLITFGSARSASAFVRGYVYVDRVVADRGLRVQSIRERFVVCHPRTAKRNGWSVVSK